MLSESIDQQQLLLSAGRLGRQDLRQYSLPNQLIPAPGQGDLAAWSN
ncbi:hypothetical protein SynBIOSE41_01275 [Synechococcus sp. BIOS-E4-1]|nr:hypothetical protein SynBIOSE41_01275 [Synechococcus sp. BIOS-E4-1]